MIDHALSRFGRLDVLFNNAGRPSSRGGVVDLKVEDFDAAIALHLRGALLGMKYAAPAMIRAGSGSIINMASISGMRAGVTSLAYSTAKAAVIHLTRCAAIELGPSGVRVNCLSPGPVVTGIISSGAAAERSEEKVAEALGRVLPKTQALARVGTADDVAQAALFLASDASALINGHNLVIDGGITAGRPVSELQAEREAIARHLAALAAFRGQAT
jgi:NAD(P)-dependent dehydrogenase (short-subunit alcohol dehydrogenase family)